MNFTSAGCAALALAKTTKTEREICNILIQNGHIFNHLFVQNNSSWSVSFASTMTPHNMGVISEIEREDRPWAGPYHYRVKFLAWLLLSNKINISQFLQLCWVLWKEELIKSFICWPRTFLTQNCIKIYLGNLSYDKFKESDSFSLEYQSVFTKTL